MYTNTNLIFQSIHLSAIIDWEIDNETLFQSKGIYYIQTSFDN